jgi:hypothetical protein
MIEGIFEGFFRGHQAARQVINKIKICTPIKWRRGVLIYYSDDNILLNEDNQSYPSDNPPAETAAGYSRWSQ